MMGQSGLPSVDRLRGELDRLVDGFVGTVGEWPGMGWVGGPRFPALNAWEDENNLYVESELPGLKMEDIEVLVCGHELTIKGERKEQRTDDSVFHRRERGTGPFSRVLRLPAEIDGTKVEASLNAGVLTVKLPKAEAARPRKIQVKANA